MQRKQIMDPPATSIDAIREEDREYEKVMQVMYPKKPSWYESLYARILNSTFPLYNKKVSEYKSQLFEQLDQSSKVFLELGVGTGANFEYYAGREGVLVYGIDPNAKMEKYARETATDVGLLPSQFKFIQAVAEMLPVATASVDVVVCTLVLCTVRDVPATLKEVHRVLKPGGCLVFLEHVAAQEGTVVRFFQTMLNPLQTFIVSGCNLNRDTLSYLENAGFASVDAQKVVVKTGWALVADHIVGVART